MELTEEQLFNQGYKYSVYKENGTLVGRVKNLEEKNNILSEYKNENLDFVLDTRQQLNG